MCCCSAAALACAQRPAAAACEMFLDGHRHDSVLQRLFCVTICFWCGVACCMERGGCKAAGLAADLWVWRVHTTRQAATNFDASTFIKRAKASN